MKEPKVFNDSNDVVTALKQNQVDAVVVDLPTAFFLTAAQVPRSKIVGQFSAPGGDTWGALLQKGSPLTQCVNQAIGDLKEAGAAVARAALARRRRRRAGPEVAPWRPSRPRTGGRPRGAARRRRAAARRSRRSRPSWSSAASPRCSSRARAGDSVNDTFFDCEAFKTPFPAVLDGFWLDVKIFVVVEIAVLILGLVVALVRTTRAPALFPLRADRGRLHRRLPRRADDPRRLPGRLRRPGARAVRAAERPGRARRASR